MASLQHKHHKYNYTTKSNAAKNRLRINRLALLNRRAGTSRHQPLRDDNSTIEPAVSNEDDYNRVCYSEEQIEDALQSKDTISTVDQMDDSADVPSMNNIQINYSLVISESNGTNETKKYTSDPAKQRAITAMQMAKISSGATSSGLNEVPTWRSDLMDVAEASSFGSSLTDPTSYPTGNRKLDRAINAITPLDVPKDITAAGKPMQPSATLMSFQTADHVPFLNLDQDSSLKDRALAVMEMLKVNSYFTKHGPTVSAISPFGADVIASESLSWQVDSLKSVETTPKSEVSSVRDIDIVVTESQEEGDTPEAGKISTLLNDFSFTVKQMINDTFTDGNLVHSDGISAAVSMPTLQNPPHEERDNSNDTVANTKTEGDTATDGSAKAREPASRRFSMGIANVIKSKKGRMRSDSLSSTGSCGSVDGSVTSMNEAGGNVSPAGLTQRFSIPPASIKSKGFNRMRSNSIGSTSSNNSKDSSIPSLPEAEQNPSMNSIKKFKMNISRNFKKLNWSRTSSTSQSSDNSVPSLHDDESIPEQLDEDVSLPWLEDDDEVSFENDGELDPCSPVSYLNSPVSAQSDEYASSPTVNSSSHSIDHSESSDDDTSSIGSDQSSCSDTETIDDNNNQSMILAALAQLKLGLKSSLNDKVAGYVAADNAKSSAQTDRKEGKEFSMNNKFSPSKEMLGLEMIAHPALLHKYD